MSDQQRKHYRTCSLCEAMCGLEFTVAGDRVVGVRGDDKDPFSRGHVCPKGPALVGLHEDPDRLRQPVRKTPRGWEPIGWDEALDEAALRLHEIQAEHGRNAVAAYIGNPAAHNAGATLYAPSLLRTLGTKYRYSATSVDQLPQMLAAYLMFGHQLLLPIPDLERTDHLVVLGANPLVSNGSIMTAPDIKRRLSDIQGRGGKIVVIDPRRTETAKVADEHVFIKPGTDAWLLMAMVHVLFGDELIRPESDAPYVRGSDELRSIVAPFTPKRAEAVTGVPAEAIRLMTRELSAAPRAVLYARVGVSMHPFGGLCHWLVNAINVLAGNLDRPGGAMFTRPAFDLVGGGKRLGVGKGSFGRWHSKVRGLPEFGGELPVATMAEDITADSGDSIRGLLTIAGNPALSTPNGRVVDDALEKLDFMVSVDFYVNETTRHADLILPPSGPLEHGHYDVVFHALAIRNTAKYSPPLFDIGPDQRHDHQILAGLERRLLKHRGASLSARASVRLREGLGPEGIVEVGLRSGPWGFGGGARQGLTGLSLGKLKRSVHGVDLGMLQPCLPGRLPRRRGTDEPHVDLVPEAFVKDVARLEASEERSDEHGELRLIGRRQLRSNNSWMHNVPKLMSGKPRCTLQVHRTDAERLGIETGHPVRITSRVGSVVAPAEVGTDVMPGVVSLPHGFGHQRPGAQLRVAAEHCGVSINDVTDEQRVDALSGVAAFSGVPVRVEPAGPDASSDS